MFDFTPDSILS